MAFNAETVRAKETTQLSHGGLSQRQTLGTDPPIQVLCQGRI